MKAKKKTKIIIVLSSIILLIALGCFGSFMYFTSKVSDDKNTTRFVIEKGFTSDEIAASLKKSNLIKSQLFFKLYLKLYNVNNIYAATYYLSPSMNLKDIINELKSGGINDNEIEITFREGLNVRQIAQIIENNTTNTSAGVLEYVNNREILNTLIAKYWFLDEAILDPNIYYPLEGYLYCDTYRFSSREVTLEEIFTKMLDRTNEILTPYQKAIEESKFTPHEIITLASLIELEGTNKENREGISSVFYNRLDKGMSLGSDVTTYYAFKVFLNERDLTQKEFDTYNPYNTRGPLMEGKLPVGPISSVSKESIDAALNPSKSDDLYFVADIDGNIYFSKTFSEHEKITEKLQKEGKWIVW